MNLYFFGGNLVVESKIIKGTLSLTLSTVIVKILGLIYKIPLASLLGDEGMGYFNSAYTVYAFFYLICTAGVPKAVMILTSEAKAKNEKERAVGIVRVAAIAFMLLGLIVSILFILLANSLARLIGNSRSAFTMVCIAPSILFISLAGVVRGYLNAEMRLLEIAVSQVIEGVGKLAFGLLFAMIGIRLNLPLSVVSAFTILGVTLGALAGVLYLLVCAKIKIIGKKTEQKIKREGNSKIIRRILSISVPITLSAAAMSITNVIDLILIMRGLQNNGYTESVANSLYGNYTTLAVPMLNLALSLITPVSIAFIPSFTQRYVKGDFEGLFSSAKNALKLTAFITAPVTLGMFFYSREILSVLFSDSGIDVGAPLLCLLCPAILFSSALLIVNSLLEAAGKVRAPIWSMLAGSIAKIAVSYVLISRSDKGIMGAPIGTSVCYGISLIIALILFVVRFKRGLPIISSFLLPLANASVAVFISKILYGAAIKSLSELISLGIAILSTGLIYLLLSFLGGVISIPERKKTSKYTNFA